MKRIDDEDQEQGFTMIDILRSRGYPEETIERILERKRAQIVSPVEE